LPKKLALRILGMIIGACTQTQHLYRAEIRLTTTAVVVVVVVVVVQYERVQSPI